jgi:hypothetical protein
MFLNPDGSLAIFHPAAHSLLQSFFFQPTREEKNATSFFILIIIIKGEED